MPLPQPLWEVGGGVDPSGVATLSAALQKMMEEQKADGLEAKLLREQDLQAHKAVVGTLAAQLAKANLSAGPK